MAMLTQNLAPPFSCRRPLYTTSFRLPYSLPITIFPENYRSVRKKLRDCRAMTAQTAAQGASSPFANEIERLSAKESLLLALSRSPHLEGLWNFEWFGIASPVFLATKLLFGRIPQTLAALSKLDLVIRNGYGTATAHVKLLNSIENKFVLFSKFSVEGPLRMKEEYVEGMLETPKIDEDTLPEQLRGALDQAANTLQRLPVPVPVPIRDTVSRGLKIPLGEAFQRLIMISYLDEEILIARNTAGEPEVLTRLDPAPDPEPISDYES